MVKCLTNLNSFLSKGNKKELKWKCYFGGKKTRIKEGRKDEDGNKEEINRECQWLQLYKDVFEGDNTWVMAHCRIFFANENLLNKNFCGKQQRSELWNFTSASGKKRLIRKFLAWHEKILLIFLLFLPPVLWQLLLELKLKGLLFVEIIFLEYINFQQKLYKEIDIFRESIVIKPQSWLIYFHV